MIRRVARSVACFTVVGVLGLSGCTYNGAVAPLGDPRRSGGTGSSGSPGVSAGPGSTGGAAASIYGPLWDVFNGGTDFVTAETAKVKAADNYLIKCMKAEGFRYTTPPVDPDQVRATGLEISYRTPIADDVARKEGGYGVTTYLVKSGYEDNAKPTTGRASLAASEQAAFDKAEAECGRKMAYEFLPGDLTDQLWRDSAPVSARILADPAVIAADKKWQSCLAESGYSFTSMDGPSAQLEKESRNVTPRSSAATRLHQKELALAETDWQCRVKYVNDVYLRVRDREESAFVEKNFERVNELRKRMRMIIFG